MKVKVGYLAYQEMEIEVDDKYKKGIDREITEEITKLAEDCCNTLRACDPKYIDICSIETDKGETIAEW